MISLRVVVGTVQRQDPIMEGKEGKNGWEIEESQEIEVRRETRRKEGSRTNGGQGKINDSRKNSVEFTEK